MKQKGRALAPWLGSVLLFCSLGVAAQDVWAEEADPSCPAQDFTRFLAYFNDPADDRVRVRYTTDPLEYETPAHESGEGAGVTELRREAGPARLRRLRAAPLRATPAITPLPEGGQQVAYGGEERYTFSRRYGCWMLTRVSRSW